MLSRRFDFAFPLGAYGNSSGWWPPRGVDLNRQPDLAARRLITLVPVGRSVFLPVGPSPLEKLDSIRVLPFFQKSPFTSESADRGLVALSSGAGSAIFRVTSGQTFKLKRCGLGDTGFTDQGYRSHLAISCDGEQVEFSQLFSPGLMTPETAAAECEMAAEFKAMGISQAYTPRGVFLINTVGAEGEEQELKRPGAAILMQIDSDLRVDELVYMCMTPMLADLFCSGRLAYDDNYKHWGFFDANTLPIGKTRQEWLGISERLQTIGISVGSAYRRCHDAGYIRGLGSCWFGNEVVDADGDISLVDFDGGAMRDNEHSHEISSHLKRLEINQYCSESLLMLTTMRPKTLMLFGADFIEGVWQGYKKQYNPIPKDLVESIIRDHFQAHPAVWKALGFAADPCTPIVTPLGLSLNHRLGDEFLSADAMVTVRAEG